MPNPVIREELLQPYGDYHNKGRGVTTKWRLYHDKVNTVKPKGTIMISEELSQPYGDYHDKGRAVTTKWGLS